MLFILTGDIQTGKTRWLEELVTSLQSNSIPVKGVLAPGVWRSADDSDANPEFVDANGYEKLGIDNVLYPQGKRIPFARRRDIAIELGLFDPDAQSAKAELAWYIDETAIEEVNAHLDSLANDDGGNPGILVVDELGRLELLRNGGLTGALRLLEAGPTRTMPHALIVVREALLPQAQNRFSAWSAPTLIAPDAASRAMVEACFLGKY